MYKSTYKMRDKFLNIAQDVQRENSIVSRSMFNDGQCGDVFCG